jgi:hypothetical protein
MMAMMFYHNLKMMMAQNQQRIGEVQQCVKQPSQQMFPSNNFSHGFGQQYYPANTMQPLNPCFPLPSLNTQRLAPPTFQNTIYFNQPSTLSSNINQSNRQFIQSHANPINNNHCGSNEKLPSIVSNKENSLFFSNMPSYGDYVPTIPKDEDIIEVDKNSLPSTALKSSPQSTEDKTSSFQ